MSQYFSLLEFIRSETADTRGIDNYPPESVKAQLLTTMAGMDRIRAFLGNPINVDSGYRCPALNAAVGGATDSQHLTGHACDFTCAGFGSPKDVSEALAQNLKLLGIDQLILEGTWVHVSFTTQPRYEVLTMSFGKYFKGIV